MSSLLLLSQWVSRLRGLWVSVLSLSLPQSPFTQLALYTDVLPVYSSFWPCLGRSAKHPCGLLVQHSIVTDFNTYVILNSFFPILSQRLRLLRHLKCINRVYWYIAYQFGKPTSEGPLRFTGEVLLRSPGKCQPLACYWQLSGCFLGESCQPQRLQQLLLASARPCSALLDSGPRGCCRRDTDRACGRWYAGAAARCIRRSCRKERELNRTTFLLCELKRLVALT